MRHQDAAAARLYLHFEQLQLALDDVRAAAFTLTKVGKEIQNDRVKALGGGLLSVHARTSYRAADLLAAVRHLLEGK